MKEILIRFLFRLLDFRYDYKDIDDKKVAAFLINLFSSLQFREYFRKRDLQLLKAMGQGMTRENYLIALGQRLELMHLLDQSSKAYKLSGKAKPQTGNSPEASPKVEGESEIIQSRKGGV